MEEEPLRVWGHEVEEKYSRKIRKCTSEGAKFTGEGAKFTGEGAKFIREGAKCTGKGAKYTGEGVNCTQHSVSGVYFIMRLITINGVREDKGERERRKRYMMIYKRVRTVEETAERKESSVAMAPINSTLWNVDELFLQCLSYACHIC